MGLNLNKISGLISLKNITKKQFCNDIGITYQGLQYMLKENRTHKATLITIANYFKVPLEYFTNDTMVINDVKHLVINSEPDANNIDYKKALSVCEIEKKALQDQVNELKKLLLK